MIKAHRLAVVPFLLIGCGGDDLTVGLRDAGREAAPFDGSFPDTSAPDAAPGDAGVDAPPPPPRLLLTMNSAATTSELIALNVATRAVDGRLTYAGNLGSTYSRGADPWLLQQRADVVAKLDAREPWKVLSSWAVALDDRADGGAAYADPYGVLVVAGGKGYVLRYNRNKIAVIDTTQVADAGAPSKTIDLSTLVQAADEDGIVEMSAGFYVASRHMLYVLLGNIDRTTIKAPNYELLCVATTETVIGIDVTTDQVVSLNGTGPGGAIALTGHNPAFGAASAAGASAVYDAANDRLLVVQAGCNTQLGDGGGGGVTKRIIEEVKLATGEVKTLLDANALDYPVGFSYIGPRDAVVGFGFGGTVRRWDPTSPTVGDVLPNAPDNFAFVYDGAGSLLGTKTNFLSDGGSSTDIVKVLIADGGTTTLATNPFTDNTGFIGGVELWPPAP